MPKMKLNSQPNYINFDRHEIYTEEMMNLNMELITESGTIGGNLTNELFGLFDGFLYRELEESTNPKIQKLINLINQKIK